LRGLLLREGRQKGRLEGGREKKGEGRREGGERREEKGGEMPFG